MIRGLFLRGVATSTFGPLMMDASQYDRRIGEGRGLS
jgi:hypothetical protein